MTGLGQPGGQPRGLVVAYDFPPHAAIGTMRTLRLVRHLAESGWAIEVLTGDPRTFRPVTPVDDALMERIPPAVKVVRAAAWRWLDGPTRPPAARSAQVHTPASASPRPGSRRPGVLGRLRRIVDAARAIPDRESAWLPPAVIAGLRHCRRPDVIYSSAPPWSGHLAALCLARRWGCPWVADFRDPWSRAPWRDDRLPFTIRAAAWLERRVVARADAVVFVTAANRDDFAALYGETAAQRFRLVANGCDVSEFEGLDPAPAPDQFVLLHAGSLYGTRRDPRPLFAAMARAVEGGSLDRRRFRVRFLGLDAPAALEAASRECGVHDMVEPLPRVGRRESLRQMVSASALLLIQPGHAVSVPGKLYEYLAAGRPVLALTDSPELATLVHDSGVGTVGDPNDASSMDAALRHCVAMAEQGLRPAPRELFDGAAQARAAAGILVDVMNARQPAGAVTVQ